MMKPLRHASCAALLAAACGGSPIESTSVAASESSTGVLAESSTTSRGTTTAPLDGSSETPVSSTEVDPSSSSSSTTQVASDESTSSDEADVSSSDDTGVPTCWPILHEVLYDPESDDDHREWIELFNPCDDDVVLDEVMLRWGGEGYVQSAPFSYSLAVGECVVIGGPNSDPGNGMPSFGVVLDFTLDLENADTAADGIALFADAAATVPFDAVIYGESNVFELIDETGMVSPPDVDDVPNGNSIARVAASRDAAWDSSSTPSPGMCPNPGL